MIDRLGQNYQSLQGLEASRSFQAAGAVAPKKSLQDITPQTTEPDDFSNQAPSSVSAQTSGVQTKSQANALAQLQPMIQEVHQIASAVGFVGVSSQDIVRAYQGGHSFLADYKV